MPIKVLIIDDISNLCTHFANTLNIDERIEVVGVGHSGAESIKLAGELKPDIILMDIEMETERAGIIAAKKILSKNPNIKIIVFAFDDDDKNIIEAYEAGVCDYILKTATPDEIIATILHINNAKNTRNLFVKTLIDDVHKLHQEQASFLYCINLVSKLSSSELDVLVYLCEGKRYREIADLRRVSESTVRVIVNKITRKLNTDNIRVIINQIKENNLISLLKKID